jgi:transposase
VTIARDRCGIYAEGAALGAPQSQQVADRFHLVLNLSATMERVARRTEQATDLAGRRACG